MYLPAVYLIVLLGKKLAGTTHVSDMKSSLYGSGEEAPTSFASPGYKPFFLVALFFAILHLGNSGTGFREPESCRRCFPGWFDVGLIGFDTWLMIQR